MCPIPYDIPKSTVSQYSIDSATGVLIPDTPGTVLTGNQPTALAVDPSSKFAYVVNRLDNTISTYSIDPATGNLTPTGTLETGSSPFRMGFDPSGKFVYVSNEASAIAIYSFAGNGSLTSVGTAMTQSGGSLALAITGSNQKAK